MKNLVMKMKKNAGFIGVETVVVAGIVTLAGLAGFTLLFNGPLAEALSKSDTQIGTGSIDTTTFGA